mmetsp:Transcript_123063/g.343258  ORF Transcript_123063/g.343258 Transcript_123063/m.343258 type:complete len:154 (-) Transcript_123063:185-646(-)
MKLFTATFMRFFLLIATTVAFSGSNKNGRRETNPAKPPAPAVLPMAQEIMTRRTAFVTGVATATLLVAAPPSIAIGAKKQKRDKVVEEEDDDKQCPCEEKANVRSCMDLCLYECVKHGGSKEECISDCGRQCKTERGQRTMATPITRKGVDYK